MKRVSVYVLYGLSIMFLVTAYDFWFTKQHWTSYYDKTFAEKADLLNNEALIARMVHASAPDAESLEKYLEARRRSQTIHFWALFKNGEAVQSSIDADEFNSIRFDTTRPRDEVIFSQNKTYFYAVEDLKDGSILVVGLRRSPQEFLRIEFETQMANIWRYLIGILIVCVGTFIFFIRDIVRAIRGLANKESRGSRGFGVSKEGELLARGLTALDERAVQLEKERDLLNWQVLPSLRTEIMSGKKPPYTFDCTLVRTDINNFSSIYNQHPVEDFAATINDFFTEVSHVVARYGGYVHEFVGDEVIYYFKDDEVANSVAAAVSAIRDIGEVAAGFHRMTMRERGYPFTVKSSLAHGRLRFGKFVNGYGLAGPSLIETVRVLSAVTEKDGNIAVFDERHLKQVEDLISAASYAEVKLKGFSDARRLVVYRSHAPLESWLHRGDPNALSALSFYRGDAHLVHTLTWLRGEGSRLPVERVLRVISLLRDIKVTKSGSEIQTILGEWINALCDQVGYGSTSSSAKILASAIRLIENLIPRGEILPETEMALRRAMEVNDGRVIANALEALASASKSRDQISEARGASEDVEIYLDHPDNRIVANALISEATKGLSPSLVKRLRRLMRAKDDSALSSALYAIGEIAEYHRTRDHVYFMTQLEFQDLLHTLPDFAGHADDRVRRQAIGAAKKAGLAEVVTLIEEQAERKKAV